MLFPNKLFRFFGLLQSFDRYASEFFVIIPKIKFQENMPRESKNQKKNNIDNLFVTFRSSHQFVSFDLPKIGFKIVQTILENEMKQNLKFYLSI